MAGFRDTKSRSEKVRAKLDHPVIDADGHLIEVEPVLLDYLKGTSKNSSFSGVVDLESG